HKKAAQLAASLGRPAEALYHLQALNEQAGGKDAEVLEAMGNVESQRRAWKNAAKCYAKAVEADPKRVSSYAAHAAVLHKQLDQPAEAEQVIARMLKANPDSPDAQIARIRFARETRQSADQKAELRSGLDQLIQRHGSTHPDLFLLAASMDVESG